MISQEQLELLHRELGLKRLNPIWAKIEIVLGLGAASCGVLVGVATVVQSTHQLPLTECGISLTLQVLGWYLALAGHRSHLYQSQNRLTAYLAGKIREIRPSN